MNCKNCGEPNTTPNFRNCERCRKKWREAQRSPTSNKLEKMQSKLATQRNEIAMLTRKLETATKKKTALLNELKWMRGENT